MAGRSHSTFKKRQKEMARVEKQREKAAKRLQKKEDGPATDSDDDILELSDDGADDYLMARGAEPVVEEPEVSLVELLRAERLSAQRASAERANAEPPKATAEA